MWTWYYIAMNFKNRKDLDEGWDDIRKRVRELSRQPNTPVPTDYFSIFVCSMVCVGIYTTISFGCKMIWNIF